MASCRELSFRAIRCLLSLWCLASLVCQAIVLLWVGSWRPSDDGGDSGAGLVGADSQMTNVYMLVLGVALGALGLHGVWKMDVHALKLFALIATLLALYLQIFWERERRGSWAQARDILRIKMAAICASNEQLSSEVASLDALFWDSFQSRLNCCGLQGPRDWIERCAKAHLPASCCAGAGAGAGDNLASNKCELRQARQTGCLERMDESIRPKFVYVYLVMGLLAFLLSRESARLQRRAAGERVESADHRRACGGQTAIQMRAAN